MSDDKLRAVFGQDRVNMMKMMGLISPDLTAVRQSTTGLRNFMQTHEHIGLPSDARAAPMPHSTAISFPSTTCPTLTRPLSSR